MRHVQPVFYAFRDAIPFHSLEPLNREAPRCLDQGSPLTEILSICADCCTLVQR